MALNAKYRHVDSTLDQASTIGELLGNIAQFLFDLHDSHTKFFPPGRAADVEYGWPWSTVGNDGHITSVNKGSDAEAKGHAGGGRLVSTAQKTPPRRSRPSSHHHHQALHPPY